MFIKMLKKIQKAGPGRKVFGRALCSGMAALLALQLTSCSLSSDSLSSMLNGNSEQTQPEEILVPVTKGSISSSLSFVGNLQYKQSSNLTWKTDGVIEKVYVKVGDRVKKGDLLAELSTDSLSSSVLLAEKNMIEQQENLENVKASESARMQAYVDLTAKESALTQAKLEQEALYYPRATRYDMERAWDAFALANLNFNYAKQDYDFLVSTGESWEGFEEEIRTTRFGRSFLVSGADSRSARERKFEDYVSTYNALVSAYEKYVWISGRPSDTDYAVAEGNVRVAQKEYDKALETWLSYESLPREKDVQAAEIGLNSAVITYNQRYIIAPFDGTVTAVTAVDDYYVKRGDNALRVDDMSEIFVPISISELDLTSVVDGEPVSISVDANYGKKYTGRIYAVSESSTVSGNTTAFGAMVIFDDPDARLLAGMTAEVSLVNREKKDALLIPNTAVSYVNGKPHVTVAAGEEHQTIEITPGIVSGNVTEVVSQNLKEGDLLVVSSISAAAMKELGLNSADFNDSGTLDKPAFTNDGRSTGSAASETEVPSYGQRRSDPVEPAKTVPDETRKDNLQVTETSVSGSEDLSGTGENHQPAATVTGENGIESSRDPVPSKPDGQRHDRNRETPSPSQDDVLRETQPAEDSGNGMKG